MTIDFGKIMDEFVAAGKDMTDKMTEVSNIMIKQMTYNETPQRNLFS